MPQIKGAHDELLAGPLREADSCFSRFASKIPVMNQKNRLFALVGAVILTALGLWWLDQWSELREIPASGGFPFPGRFELKGPHFQQSDPRWGQDLLGNTQRTLAAEGCAVASAAMVLAMKGVQVDPGVLNRFLTAHRKGYTDRGWIYWETAAEFDPVAAETLLPHYEDLPSFRLIDTNLIRNNPVIARVRTPSGITHFVVIVGKDGFDYLVRDPAHPPERGAYPLKELGSPIEAIRFYNFR
ncbi:MAG: hypothetical protein Fur0032_16500 [Terrimicrobiaceae bacterium]